MERRQPSLESLWHSTAEPVRRFLFRLIGDLETANDLLSQTFLEAARHWNRYREGAGRKAWLFGIARNLAKGELRRRGRHREEQMPETIPFPATAEQTLEDAEDLVRTRQAIEQLPPLLQQTLLLRLVDELSYDEIAAALDIPIGTVRSRLHDAIRRLRDQLNPRLED